MKHSITTILIAVLMCMVRVNVFAHDSKVDKSDLNLLVDYIMGKNPIGFYESIADLNGDKKINATDVVIPVKQIKN